MSIPCCHECWKPLEYSELKEVVEGRIKLSKKDYEKLKKEGKETNCPVCHKLVSKSEAHKMRKDVVLH